MGDEINWDEVGRIADPQAGTVNYRNIDGGSVNAIGDRIWSDGSSIHFSGKMSKKRLYEFMGNPDWPTAVEPGGPKQCVSGGRPSDPVWDWAREEVHVKHRPPQEVYADLRERYPKRLARLTDPYDSFKKAIRQGT